MNYGFASLILKIHFRYSFSLLFACILRGKDLIFSESESF